MSRRALSIAVKALGVWGLMLAYWVGTVLNIHSYLTAVAVDGNYDFYILYLRRAAWLNFPVRSLDEWLHISSGVSPVGDLTMGGGEPALELLVHASWEIILLDCLAGSCFWLLLLQLATATLSARSRR